MSTEEILTLAERVVNWELLPQYEAYVGLKAVVRALEDRKMHASVELARSDSTTLSSVLRDSRGSPYIEDLSERIFLAKAQLASISDAMKFDTPIIWMMYKYKAYLGTSTAIQTLADLTLHCAKPGYICTKRFAYVNDYLKDNGRASLLDSTAYPKTVSLPEMYERPEILVLANDGEFMKGWMNHEYHHQGNRVAKWENYTA